MLAIVIPYYNYTYFRETLDSLANQTNKQFKVYIGDDYSSISPLALLSKYEKKIDFKYKKFATNLGSISLVKQWERCIEMTANEPWLQILGDDDVLDKNCVALFYKNLEEIGSIECNVIRFASRYIGSNGKSLIEYDDFFHPKLELATDSFFRNYDGNSRSSLSEHIFKRTAFERFRFYDYPLAWYSDNRAWLEFSNFKYIYTINDALASIRVTEGSITGKNSNQLLKNKVRYLFFKNLIFDMLSHFNRNQKNKFLLEYGILIKEQDNINIRNTVYVSFQLLRIGAFISLLKFMRRMFIAKKTKINN